MVARAQAFANSGSRRLTKPLTRNAATNGVAPNAAALRQQTPRGLFGTSDFSCNKKKTASLRVGTNRTGRSAVPRSAARAQTGLSQPKSVRAHRCGEDKMHQPTRILYGYSWSRRSAEQESPAAVSGVAAGTASVTCLTTPGRELEWPVSSAGPGRRWLPKAVPEREHGAPRRRPVPVCRGSPHGGRG